MGANSSWPASREVVLFPVVQSTLQTILDETSVEYGQLDGYWLMVSEISPWSARSL